MDIPDLCFRLERVFGVQITRDEVVGLLRIRDPLDIAAGDLFDLVRAKIGSGSAQVVDSEADAESLWPLFQRILSDCLGVEPGEVTKDTSAFYPAPSSRRAYDRFDRITWLLVPAVSSFVVWAVDRSGVRAVLWLAVSLAYGQLLVPMVLGRAQCWARGKGLILAAFLGWALRPGTIAGVLLGAFLPFAYVLPIGSVLGGFAPGWSSDRSWRGSGEPVWLRSSAVAIGS